MQATTRLQRLGFRARVAIWSGIVLLLLVPTLTWVAPEFAGTVLASRAGPRLLAAGLAAGDRWIGWVLTMPPYVIVAAGLAQLIGFCRQVEQRRMFTAAGVTALRRVGWALIAASILLPLSRIAIRFVVAPYAAELFAGAGMLRGLLPLLPMAMGVAFGMVFVAFAAVLGEAVRLAEENESFV